MGNCNTEKEQIGQPSSFSPSPRKAVHKKPQPLIFKIPQNIADKKQTYTFMKNKITDKIVNEEIVDGWQNYKKTLSELKPNTKYTDDKFKANMKSIGEINVKNVQWRRPHEVLKKITTFMDQEIDMNEFRHGKLENYYFLSALSAIEKYPEIIEKIFEIADISEQGIYAVWLFINGKWNCYAIDDLFPFSSGQYLFNKHKNQLWIMLLEKAYSKVFKSYENIKSGFTGYALNAITGAPFEYLNKNSTVEMNKNEIWDNVREAFKKKYIILASTENFDNSREYVQEDKYSYPVIDCQEVYVLTPTNKRMQKIVKLANPWGRYEWKGRWSQYSDVWSEQLRHQLDYEKADESILWISIEDLLLNFGQICICKYNKEYLNTSIDVAFSGNQNQFKGIFLNIDKRFQGTMSIIQQDFRQFNKNYKYSMVRLTLFQLNTETNRLKSLILETSNTDYYTSKQIQLDFGTYYILIEMEWSSAYTRDIVVNFYGNCPVNIIEDPQKIDMQSFFYEYQALKEIEVKNDGQNFHVYNEDEGIRRTCYQVSGYLIVHYANNSKNKHLCEKMDLRKSSYLEGCTEQEKNGFNVDLAPGQQLVKKIKISPEGKNSFNFDPVYSHKVVERYTKEELLQLIKKKPNKRKQRQIEGKKIQVYVKTFSYSGGIALLYENRMTQKSYIEEIEFEIKNLRLQSEQLGSNMKCEFELAPVSQKMFWFSVVKQDEEYVFKTKVSYYIADPQFRF